MFDYPRIQDGVNDDQRYATNLADMDRRLEQDDGYVQFRASLDEQDNMGSDGSGFCSPPLWKNSPSQPLISHHVHTSLSPKSRLQAITRGQRELMEMVRNLPESSYELSLKDLVEHRHQMESQASPLGKGLYGSKRQKGGVKVKRQGSFEIENKGLFLKMGFPFSLQSKKRKKLAGNGSGRVSPKPEGLKGSGGERDWWKKKFTGSSDSDSSRTSNNSGSSGSSSGTTGSCSSSNGSTRKNKGFLRSCLPFSQCRRSKCVN